LNGKSIKQLSQETGKGEWAIRKQIQRYRNSQKPSKEIHLASQEQIVPIAPEQKPANKLATALAAIGFMIALFFIYMEIKKKSKKNADQ
jgi:hypothetical protein